MTHYHFKIEHAVKYGVNEAIFIQNFTYWINHNKANEKNFHDGRYWTFNSVSAFIKLFPFFSKKQIENILISLIEKGVLIKGNYNPNTYDRTCWYAFVDEEEFLLDDKKEKCISPKGEMDSPSGGNGFPQNGKPIPDNKPDNKPYIKQEERFANATPLFLASLLLEKIKAIHEKFKTPDLNKWADHIDKMIRLDNRTEEEIRSVIEWIFSNPDPFWSTNILSTEKLRKQFDKIIIQMSKRKPVDVKETADKKKVELMKTNQQTAKQFAKKYEGHSSIRVKASDHCIEIYTFGRQKNQTTMLGYAEHGFREQVESFLRKLEV